MSDFSVAIPVALEPPNTMPWIKGQGDKTLTILFKICSIMIRLFRTLNDFLKRHACALVVIDFAAVLKAQFLEGVQHGGVVEIRVGFEAVHALFLHQPLHLLQEESAKAIDLGGYYRVPADNRDLNYDKYFVTGDPEKKLLHQYTSHNTERLDVAGTIAKMKTTDYIKEELAKLGE